MGDDMIDLSAIPKAKDLIDQLGSKIIVLMRKEDDALHEVFRLKGTVKHLQDKLAKAVEALRWYADFGNYLSGSGNGEYAPIDLDKGGKAEEVLAELEGKEEATCTAWRGRDD